MLDGVLDDFLRCWMHLQGCVLANTVLDEFFRVLDGVLDAFSGCWMHLKGCVLANTVLDAIAGCWMGCWMSWFHCFIQHFLVGVG